MLPAIFHTSLWFTPESQRDEELPAEFLIQTFPYHFLSAFQLQSSIDKLDGVYTNTIERTILNHCILDFRNVTDTTGATLTAQEALTILPNEVIMELLVFVFEIAMYSDGFSNEVKSSVYAALDPRFSDQSWDCETCQTRKLDRQRNCPYLDKETHDRSTTYPTHAGTVMECPIGNIDRTVCNKAIEAFNYRKQGILPEDGGIRNQTVFFMLASQEVENIKNYYEEQESKKSSK